MPLSDQKTGRDKENRKPSRKKIISEEMSDFSSCQGYPVGAFIMRIKEERDPKEDREAEERFLNLLLDMIIRYGPEVLAEADEERSIKAGGE